MNDQELDQLLNSWEAPAPPKAMRDRLRARFPRPERRRRFAHPLRWVLVAAALSGALAVGMEQTGATPWDFRIGDTLARLFPHFFYTFEFHRAAYIVGKIRSSDPRVYIGGNPAEPIRFGPAARMDLTIPGDGDYSLILVSGLNGWTEAGSIHDNVIEFQAGGTQVRIECNSQLVDSSRPVFIRRRPER